MQVTDAFKKQISDHLQSVADKDPLFAETFKKPAKNIGDCITYILNQVRKTGKNAFADEEIYGMAIHYYDEDNIEVGNSGSGRVAVKHVKAEKKEAKATDTAKIAMPKKTDKPVISVQPSLF